MMRNRIEKYRKPLGLSQHRLGKKLEYQEQVSIKLKREKQCRV